VRDVAVVVGVAVVGFGVAFVWLSGGALFKPGQSVPRVLELSGDDAKTRLESSGYRPRVTGSRPNAVTPRGHVIRQDPPPGVMLPRGAPVELVTSAGAGRIPMPDVSGLAVAHAERVIRAAGLRVGSVDSITDRGRDPGIVLATRPAPGEPRDPGSSIGLVINRAAP
jgi:serine/threonine-protein kinase